jgi:uncharacterized SAM-binding protein YcdF (DUF218 family)
MEHETVVRRLRNVFFLGAIIFLLSGCGLSRYAKQSYEIAGKSPPYDAIIVPGIPYSTNKTSALLKMRMLWAKHLYDEGLARNVIFSGSAVYTPFVESIAMKTMADSMGIPSTITFSETEAEHSTENVYYSWKMARGLGFRRIALATDPFQAAMLRGFIRKHTPGVEILPVIFSKLDLKEQDLPAIDTTASYKKNFVSIKDRENFFERIRGTFGRRVREEKKIEASRQEQYSAN